VGDTEAARRVSVGAVSQRYNGHDKPLRIVFIGGESVEAEWPESEVLR
jgi:hypothetical protein